MKIVGVVGRSGSGKSAVARHLAARGAGLIDGDGIGHEVLDDPEVREALRRRFGDAVFRGRRVDRGKLGARVFGDADALAALNAIVHPRIIDRCARRIAAYRKEGRRLAVVDAALLLEVPLPFELDLVIALRCDRPELERRLRKKGVPPDAIEARLDRQEHLEKSFDRASAVLDASRPLPEVLAAVDKLIEPLTR